MTPRANFLTYWYYHVPDLILAALIYLLLARLLVALIWDADNRTAKEELKKLQV